jgi:XRE family aerobic/anaerobic benzoate catabolism transcriptional regulator
MNAPLTPAQHESAYLARLGGRVRALRDGIRMTRRSLAESSGVSERYLAQLEAGRGNISVLLLRKIAQAMNTGIEALVRDDDARRTPKRRVALIGLRGAGKSSLGTKLAAHLGAPFVELDSEVEREAGTRLGEVFSLYGQEAFRRFEQRALDRVLRTHDDVVIATGGSLVTDPDTYNRVLEDCCTIWLKASAEEHMARVIAQGDLRPFKGRAAALEEIRRLLAGRERLYARADAVVDTSGRTIKQSLADLRRALEEA